MAKEAHKMKNKIKYIKLTISLFGVLSTGAFLAVIIENGLDHTLATGLILGIILAICAGIGAYEDFKK